MFTSVIYVSRSLIAHSAQKAELEDIVGGSVDRNSRLGVRGALIFTELHFAQLLEGPEQAIDEVMASIERDQRHEKITVIERKSIDGYRFPDWGLAYWGTASYMDQKIAAILEKRDALAMSTQTTQLYDLMRLLAQESRTQDMPIGRPSPKS